MQSTLFISIVYLTVALIENLTQLKNILMLIKNNIDFDK